MNIVNIDIDPRWFPPHHKKIFNEFYLHFVLCKTDCARMSFYNTIYLKYKIYFLKCIT